ncbi:hypothetical protein PR202_gb12684 [Eleusine coracana subsp. coracana]|uniref:Guanosine nucleotide diphosphate dissociation inhibitor n=1 Tax=Eleusine coracana subsp. coracana TaxID=191504 RepID=A0AAV5ER78_ELECO|nr:hypothetical protein PR202_gb12684 [Eleusine coracana subsp. coracana]
MAGIAAEDDEEDMVVAARIGVASEYQVLCANLGEGREEEVGDLAGRRQRRGEVVAAARAGAAYVFCCSYSHNVASKGKFIAFVSAQAESDNPEKELKPGIDLLGPVDELFIDTYDRYEPTNDSSSDNCFISTSYDATTHFESTVMDVLSLYTKITGKTVDLSVDLSAASGAEDDDA